ncbi:MAG: histidinol-phosphate transaminase [Dokdonella sp.]|uniref:histidinol-phosphate transaminase n=1 Tax=Dokdonella sp. TaxID=2291710 RepID=UPI002C5C4431|nr:histidinol-phosphate transaminase [Dokdonella sp.]HOX70231.1 histidinol-phosphate transaminase [Dokdonella sp.]
MSVLALARPEVLTVQGYSSARHEAGKAEVMLNANESPWLPPGLQAESRGMPLNRYPDPQSEVLLERLAELYGVGSSQILVARGSDEAIDLLTRAFCRPGVDAVALSPPTFGMYAVCAEVQGAARIEVPLTGDFAVDVPMLCDRLPRSVKLVFICSPNNPTGGSVALVDIERIGYAMRGRALVIVDEAYIEFSSSPSVSGLIRHHENLGVLRTLSKAWALAGARLGCLLAGAEIITLLRKIMPPYPLPTPSLGAALAALTADGMALTRQRIALIVAERERMSVALLRLPSVIEVLPSHANFLCVRFADAPRTYLKLLAAGVIVRDVGRHPALSGFLRLSIGTREENSRLLEVLIRHEVSE